MPSSDTMQSKVQMTPTEICDEAIRLDELINRFSFYIMVTDSKPELDPASYDRVQECFREVSRLTSNLRQWADNRWSLGCKGFDSTETEEAFTFIQSIVRNMLNLSGVFYTEKDNSEVFDDVDETVVSNYFNSIIGIAVAFRNKFSQWK